VALAGRNGDGGVQVATFLLQDIVKLHPIFSILCPTAIARLQRILRPLQLAPASMICRQGEASSEAYILLQGSMQAQTAEGKRLATLESGSVVGELSMLGVLTERSCSIVTATLCHCYMLFQRELYAAFRDMPWIIAAMVYEATSLALGHYVFREKDKAHDVIYDANRRARTALESSVEGLKVLLRTTADAAKSPALASPGRVGQESSRSVATTPSGK
jgi:hypothetical protein